MNRRLYLIAGVTLLLGVVSTGVVGYLQGDFAAISHQQEEKNAILTQIALADGDITASLDSIQIKGQTVTITEGGEYVITGSASQVTVNVAKEVTEDVTVHLNNASFAALEFESSGTNIVDLDKESTNVLSGGTAGLTATNVTVMGDGTLEIKDVEQYGIFTTEDLVIEAGRLSIQSAGSALYTKNEKNNQHGNLTINGGELTIAAGESEGATGLYAGNQLTINNGTITVEQAYEAYVAQKIAINGGTANLTALSAGIAARKGKEGEDKSGDAELTISDGSTTVSAGLNALLVNGDLNISGGTNSFATIGAYGSALNYTGEAKLTGGTVWTFGNGTFSTLEQPVVEVALTGNAGDTVTIVEAAGNEIEAITAPVAFINVTYSSGKVMDGENYFVSTTSGSYGQGTASTSVEE